MEPNRKVEFRTGSGTVSPFVLDNLTRYALPELATYGESFVVQHGGMEVGFGLMQGCNEYGSQYVVVLRERDLEGPGGSIAENGGRVTQKVFHFLGNNMVQSHSAPSVDPVMSYIKDQQTAAVLESEPATHTMQREDLEKIISAWMESDKFDGRALGILQRLCAVEYKSLPKFDDLAAAAEAYPMRHAHFILESAVQILAADERVSNGMRRREKFTDISEHATRHDSYALTIGRSKTGGPSVESALESSIKQSCTPGEVVPGELERIAGNFYDQYPQAASVEACYDFLQRASQAGTLCRESNVTYSSSYMTGVIERAHTESFLVLGSLVDTDNVPVEFAVRMQETQDYFMSNKEAGRPFEAAREFGGYFLPHSQNMLTQYHLEEMTGILGRLGLLLRPTRWG